MTNLGSESYAAFGSAAATSRIAGFLEWLATRRGLRVPLPELAYHLEQAGFVGLETYGSWDARDVERIEGARLIVSAVRPEPPPGR